MQPRELVDHAVDLVLASKMQAFAALWAEDGILEFPFADSGAARRLTGRAAVQEYLGAYPEILRPQRLAEKVVHQSTEAETMIVEFAIEGTVVPTGRPYLMRYIAVITVRDGEIAHYRDYFSPLAAADILAGTGAAGQALSGGAPG
ncbi:nuclear transport factor 2 family protein [Actinoalloteichus hymeniacidonis]|uniref:Ketosteroid isomerase-like protein n=1 Tax=Actinoalloteichus hymeniacidonis TaxID=340345 RepID=A0AAC9HPG1_9PSEU|nr:nuclear transport factor 2 family protein [Actinoalloteichus hymeniacidonis]AOS63147.1 ketosteroid isomerase-like protein [Actinoalloteichus hymeniacidonis]MBB5908816.1 ketosteroid isomerase-like protein [Actinoalloteichus hymeniacidonis]